VAKTEYMREYYQKNKDKFREKQARWRAKGDNRERMNELERQRMRRKRTSAPIEMVLKGIKDRARKQGVAFNLTKDWYLAHMNICAVTGIELEPPGATRGIGGPWRAEVDRIKAGGDYTMDNCRLVCAMYNKAKQNWTDEEVLKMAEALTGEKSWL